MIDIEEFRTVSKDKLIEVTDYIHSVDISPTEKKKRTLELAITLFMSSIVINMEEIAKVMLNITWNC